MKQKLTKLLCSVFLVAFAIPAIAQSSGGSSTRTITGKVTDSEGAPIIGAVVMASQREATTTNSEGRYTLAVQSPDAVLRFSCMGYRPRSENTAGRTVVDVSLETDNQLLEDVVVVGYGVQKKVNLTGSVASIDFSKTSESRSIISTSAALAGLAAGMNVTQSSGQPGSDNATIRIRGDGSFTSGANGPLVLVDGVEWSMDNVNPNDIASISVLKDAASASIYGTRAANGVILITTKNGSSGKAQISYSYKGILQMPYNDLHFVSDYARHMELINESCDNIGTSRIFSQSNIDLWREKSADPYGVGENGVPNFALYPNTDWFDEIFENGYSQEHNLSISGGSEKIRYLLSLGYLDNQGVMGRFGIDSSTQKVNFRTNLEADVTKWFTAGVRLFGQRQEYGLANISGAFNALYQTTPGVYPGSVNAWGRPALAAEESSNANNIFGMMYGSGGYNNSTRVNGSVYATIRPYKGVSVEATVNYSPTFGERHSYGRENGYWDYTTDTRYSSSDLSNAGVSNTTSRNYYLSSEILARYTAAIGDHDFGVLFGYSAMEYRTWGWGVSKQGATDWTLNDLGTYETLSGSSSTAKNGWGLRSYFGRVNYNFREKYLLSFTMRADGSSKFAAGNRWGYFPAASAGWIVDEEAFWPRNKVVSSLKLRASYGLTGNNGIGLYDTYGSYNSAYQYNGMSTTTTGEMPNSNLTWESTTQVNAGLDMGLADDRVRVSFDYYDKVTRNLLFDVTLPNTTGYGSVVSNVGKVRFYGVDLAISSVNISRGDFTWTTDFTYNFNMNKVLKLPDNGNVRNRMDGITIGDGSQFGGIAEGERMGRIYGYKVDHIIETQADADAAMYDASSRGYRRSDRRQIAGRKDIGDYEWVNRAGSTQRDGRDIINEEDQFLLGYATPHSTGGIGNTFRYRNWSLNIYMDYALGHSIQNEMQMRYFMATMGNCNWNLVNDVKQCWSQPGDKTKYARFTANDPDWGNRNFSRMSDVFVEKGDYLCIRDISLSYKLPVRWTSRLGMKDVTLTVSGNTLYYWTAVHGVSPEAATTGGLYNDAEGKNPHCELAGNFDEPS